MIRTIVNLMAGLILLLPLARPADALAPEAGVWLETATGERTRIGTVQFTRDGQVTRYQVRPDTAAFAEHFLSMRPFKCVEGPDKLWCHVPYPYEIRREITDGDMTDLEYDFLFVWKGAGEYGINMWNGVYYRITRQGDSLVGEMHEIDMGGLAVPPPAGDLRPIMPGDLHPADADSHWLPRLVIE